MRASNTKAALQLYMMDESATLQLPFLESNIWVYFSN